MELCECGHEKHGDAYAAYLGRRVNGFAIWYGGCPICGCPEYKPRHDARYDPDDTRDIGYSDEGFPYSGLGKVRR